MRPRGIFPFVFVSYKRYYKELYQGPFVLFIFFFFGGGDVWDYWELIVDDEFVCFSLPVVVILSVAVQIFHSHHSDCFFFYRK